MQTIRYDAIKDISGGNDANEGRKEGRKEGRETDREREVKWWSERGRRKSVRWIGG